MTNVPLQDQMRARAETFPFQYKMYERVEWVQVFANVNAWSSQHTKLRLYY